MKKQYVWLCVAVASCLALSAGAMQYQDSKTAPFAAGDAAQRPLSKRERAQAASEAKVYRFTLAAETKAIAAAKKAHKPYKRKFKVATYRITTCGDSTKIGDYVENSFDGTRWQYNGPTVSGDTASLTFLGGQWVLKVVGDPSIVYQYSNPSSATTPPLTGWIKNVTYGGSDPVPILSIVGAAARRRSSCC